MPTGLRRIRYLHRSPSWILLPGLALAISAASMLVVFLVVSGYAFHAALTHGSTVDPARIDEFGRTTGQRLGPATSLALAFLIARWLVAERGRGWASGLVLAALLTATGVAIGWAFGDPPDPTAAASGFLFAGATLLGGWLGRRDVGEAEVRRRFFQQLCAAGSHEAVVRALEAYLGPGRHVDLYAEAPTAPRWLAGSAGEPPSQVPLPEAFVACGPDGHAVVERGDARSHRRLASVLESVGVHLQRLALRAEGESAGARAERERLAGDIHDTMAQSLAAVTTHLEAATSALSSRASDTARHLEAATSSARTALAELRGLVWALRPAAERVPLGAALQRCIDRVAMESGLPIALTAEPLEVELSPEVELCLLRAAQEALRNAVRHGAPSGMRVALTRTEDRIELTVEDDGAGFDPDAAPAVGPDRGHGLRAMAARVARLGGTQEIVSHPGRGTRLTVRMPRRRKPRLGP